MRRESPPQGLEFLGSPKSPWNSNLLIIVKIFALALVWAKKSPCPVTHDSWSACLRYWQRKTEIIKGGWELLKLEVHPQTMIFFSKTFKVDGMWSKCFHLKHEKNIWMFWTVTLQYISYRSSEFMAILPTTVQPPVVLTLLGYSGNSCNIGYSGNTCNFPYARNFSNVHNNCISCDICYVTGIFCNRSSLQRR